MPFIHNIHIKTRTNKFKPIDLFFSNNDFLTNITIENIIKSQKNINNNRDIYIE